MSETSAERVETSTEPDELDETVRSEPSATHVPFFFGGIVLGALLAAAIGLDLSERPRERYLSRLEDERRALAAELESLREKVASRSVRASREGISGDLPPVAEVIRRIEAGDRAAIATTLPALLEAGEPGYDTLVEALRDTVTKSLADIRRSTLLLPMVTAVARNEAAFADFLGYALGSDTVQRDRALREWLLTWGAEYFAGVTSASLEPARAALKQSLEKELQSPDADVWLVMNSLERLQGRAPVDSIRRLLSREGSARAHGNLLKRLESRGDADAVRALSRYVEAYRGVVTADSSSWPVQLALDALARIGAKDRGVDSGGSGARQALEAFRAAREPLLRARAELAWFTIPRSEESARSLLEFLNSSSPRSFKLDVVRTIARRSPELHAALRARSGLITDVPLREAIAEAATEASVVPASFREGQ